MAKRRLEWFNANGPCVECGSWDDLELDHKDYKVKWKHAIWSYSQMIRVRELSKCQVLCSSCHKKKNMIEGSKVKGSHHGHAKLTETQVVEILLLLSQGSTPTEISKIYPVSDRMIRNIRDGANWKHVSGG